MDRFSGVLKRFEQIYCVFGAIERPRLEHCGSDICLRRRELPEGTCSSFHSFAFRDWGWFSVQVFDAALGQSGFGYFGLR